MIIESHAHYSHYKFKQIFRCLLYRDGQFFVEERHRDTLFDELKSRGIKACVEPAIGIDSLEKVHRLAEQYPRFVFPAYGCHPTRTFLAKWKDRKTIDAYAEGGCVAIGETGLDYHYPRREQHRLCQKRWFRYQLKLAHKLKKPLILHVRQASGEALNILRKHRRCLHGGVVHCFSDNYEIAKAFVDLGLHIGIGATLLTEKSAAMLSEVVTQIPLENIVVETDAPYVLPDTDVYGTGKKKRNTRNTSAVIGAVIERIAQIKGLSPAQVEEAMYNNTVTLFALDL